MPAGKYESQSAYVLSSCPGKKAVSGVAFVREILSAVPHGIAAVQLVLASRGGYTVYIPSRPGNDPATRRAHARALLVAGVDVGEIAASLEQTHDISRSTAWADVAAVRKQGYSSDN